MALTDSIIKDTTPNTLKDLIVQELIVNEYIKRLLEPAADSAKRQAMALKDYELNIIPECAAVGRVARPVLFEMVRIVNNKVLPAGPFLSQAGFFMFGTPGSEQTHVIETHHLKQLLLDNREVQMVKPCYGGKAVMIALDRQLLLDHCHVS